jgi:hypothetical protein
MPTSSTTFFTGALAFRRVTDLHLAWLDAEDDAHEAYLAWGDADGIEQQADAFAVYVAALDREEAAARALQDELEHVCNA